MAKNTGRVIAFALTAVLMQALCLAQEQAVPPPLKLGNWWEDSSLASGPAPEPFLFHAEGTLSYMNAQGNTYGNSFDGSGSFVVRKKRVTSRLETNYTKRNMVYGFGGGSMDYIASTLREHVEYDLTKNMLLAGGIEDYEDTLYFMDRRLTPYGGLGATVVRTERHKVNIIVGMGYAAFVFAQAAMARVNPVAVAGLPTFTPASGGGLVMQSWRWNIAKQISLAENGSYMDYVSEGLGHQWTLGVTGNIPVAKKLSVAIGYQIKDEDNIYIQALGVKTQDRTFTTGFKISL